MLLADCWSDLDFVPLLMCALPRLLAICCSVGSRLCSCSDIRLARIVTLHLTGCSVIGGISTLLLCGCWCRSDRYSAPHRLFGVRSDLDFAPFRLLVSLGSLRFSFTGCWVSGRISTFLLFSTWFRLDRYDFPSLAVGCLFGYRLCSF